MKSSVKKISLGKKLVCDLNFCKKVPGEDGINIHKINVTDVTKTTLKGIKKVSIGHESMRKAEKVLMVVGATGSGKSTLINGMVNYILGVDFEDPFRFKLIAEESTVSQAHSQTNTVTAYCIHQQDGSPLNCTITIVDTPGFGDTRGIKRDKEITEQIKSFFSMRGNEGIPFINAICFVAKASSSRLTPTQKYIFDSILAIFGKNIYDNIYMMLTFADNHEPTVIKALEEDKIPYKKYFKFNNAVLFAGLKDTFNELLWEMGKTSFENFFIHLDKSTAISLTQTKEVLEERERLEVTIRGLHLRIDVGMSKMSLIQQEKLALLEHEAEITANKNFKRMCKKPIHVREYQPNGVYVTNCSICCITCHFNCKYPNDDQKINCSSMRNNRCTVCKGKCYWDKHHNDPFYYLYGEVDEEITLQSLKEKYNKAKEKEASAQDMLKNLQKDLDDERRTVQNMVLEVHESLNRLDKIALRPDPLSPLKYLELLIEAEKGKGEPGFQDRIKFYEDLKKESRILEKVKKKEQVL